MAKPRLRELLKTKKGTVQAIWLEENHCKAHGHTYASHWNCYVKEYPEGTIHEKVAYVDIETTGLEANWDIMTCYCIRPAGSNRIIESIITKKEIQDWRVLDRRLCEDFVRDIIVYDRIIYHYGSRFDAPFARTRCVQWGIPFPKHKQIWQSDTWLMSRAKLRMSSNRLEAIADLIGCSTEKTKLNFRRKWQVLTGCKEGLEYIIDHCRRDVVILEKVFKALEPYVALGRTSI